jgi:uncharacterized membrane protein
MFPQAFVPMVKKQLIVMTRYPLNFLVSFVTILIGVLMFTFAALMFNEGGVEFGGESGTGGSLMIFGFVLYLFVSSTLWDIGYSIRWEQYEGTLEALYLTPANKFASLVSRVTVTLVWTGLNALVALFFVQYVLGRLPFHNPGLALYILIMALLGTFGFGFAFAAYTYAVDAFRSTLMGYPDGFPELMPIGSELVVVTGFGLLMPLLGYGLYKAAERKVRVDGTLAEF